MRSLALLLNQVISGKTRCIVNDVVYYIHPPTPEDKLEASYIYDDVLYQAGLEGVLLEHEMLSVMIERGMWSMDDESTLNSLPDRIDALKLEMYKKHEAFQSKQVKQIRKNLDKVRKQQIRLSSRRHIYDLYTCEGLANVYSLQYLITKNVFDVHGNRVDIDNYPGFFLQYLTEEYMDNRLDELQLRSLSKYPKWRIIWSSGRQEGRVFGVPSIFLTEEQQTLIAWSKLYDNLNEHPEPPSDEVIDDDDLLDGWLIMEQNKKKDERKEKIGSGANGQELFVPAETPEDAKRIHEMNASSSKFLKQQRMQIIKNKGSVKEEDMPDSKQRMVMQATQQFKDKMKGNK